MNIKSGVVMGLLAVFGSAFAKESVFFVGAHPDDAEGYAATAFLLREKYDLHVVDLTRGELGLGEEGLKDGSTAKKRMAEEAAACAYLGATPHFLSEVDGYACAGQPSVDQLVALLRAYKPKAVFTHWPLDRHSDHVQTAAVVFHALDVVRKDLKPEFYFFEVMLNQTKNWHPIYSVDVTSTIENKLTMLRKYECQNEGDALALANLDRAALRGRQRLPRCPFAETFTTYDGRPIEDGVLTSLGARVVTFGDAPYPRELATAWHGGKRTDRLHLSHVHRGGGIDESPDNTLETFMWCWRNGSALECDCRKTKDGVGILLHDSTLKRTARGISPEMAEKAVSTELTWDEIKDVDVGSYLGEQFKGQHIPTIDATFAAMKGHPTYLCFVDEKGAGPEMIAQKAREAGVQDQVYYTTSKYDAIIDWGKVMPDGKALIWIGAWPKNHGASERARTDAHFRKIMARLRANDFKHVSAVSLHTYFDPTQEDPFLPSTPLLREMITEFHAHDITVCSIPFLGGEKEEVYHRLFALGCDGFSTDYPRVMFKVIKELKAACE